MRSVRKGEEETAQLPPRFGKRKGRQDTRNRCHTRENSDACLGLGLFIRMWVRGPRSLLEQEEPTELIRRFSPDDPGPHVFFHKGVP